MGLHHLRHFLEKAHLLAARGEHKYKNSLDKHGHAHEASADKQSNKATVEGMFWLPNVRLIALSMRQHFITGRQLWSRAHTIFDPWRPWILSTLVSRSTRSAIPLCPRR